MYYDSFTIPIYLASVSYNSIITNVVLDYSECPLLAAGSADRFNACVASNC
jgi:hypothetical protein